MQPRSFATAVQALSHMNCIIVPTLNLRENSGKSWKLRIDLRITHHTKHLPEDCCILGLRHSKRLPSYPMSMVRHTIPELKSGTGKIQGDKRCTQRDVSYVPHSSSSVTTDLSESLE